jgi:hypothetical protein
MGLAREEVLPASFDVFQARRPTKAMHEIAISRVVHDTRQHSRERTGLSKRLGKSLLAEELVGVEGGGAALEGG